LQYFGYIIVEKEVDDMKNESRNIAILKMDEIYSFVKKNSGDCDYGLLSIGTEMRLLHIISAMEM